MNEIAQYQPSAAQALVPRSVDEAIKLAETLAKAQLVPDHLQNRPGDCLLIIMQAQRWGMDALSVAQCTSVVHGKLCYEGKLVAAVLYAMGAVEGRLHYEIKGSGQGASITVSGKPRGGTGMQSVTGSVKDWRTYGKNKQGERVDNAWDKMPEDMLVYRGTRQWARRYAPEALLGVYTPDELEEVEVKTVSAPVQMPQAKSEKAPDVVDAEFTEQPRQQEPEPQPPQQQAPQQPQSSPALTDSMRRVLDAKLASAGITLDALTQGFGEVTAGNINQAFKWISSQGGKP